MIKNHEKEIKQAPAFTSFPYTHGEAITNLRGQIRTEMRADMQQFM